MVLVVSVHWGVIGDCNRSWLGVWLQPFWRMCHFSLQHPSQGTTAFFENLTCFFFCEWSPDFSHMSEFFTSDSDLSIHSQNVYLPKICLCNVFLFLISLFHSLYTRTHTHTHSLLSLFLRRTPTSAVAGRGTVQQFGTSWHRPSCNTQSFVMG